jgi:hypothetical protein
MDMDYKDDLASEYRVVRRDNKLSIYRIYLKNHSPWNYDEDTFTRACACHSQWSLECLAAALEQISRAGTIALSRPILDAETDFPGQQRYAKGGKMDADEDAPAGVEKMGAELALAKIGLALFPPARPITFDAYYELAGVVGYLMRDEGVGEVCRREIMRIVHRLETAIIEVAIILREAGIPSHIPPS